MLHKSDYLRIGKRSLHCVECGESLAETERHPTVLLAKEDARAAKEAASEAAVPRPDEGGGGESPGAAAKGAGAATEEEESDFLRRDYCPACWEKLADRAYFSFWVGRRTEDDVPPKRLNRAGRNLALAALFDSLAERNGEENDYDAHLFFLAHLLMKYKVFRWRSSVEDPETGATVLRFRKEGTGDEALVPQADMPDEMIVKIKEEIEAYLLESTGQEIRL